MRGGGGPGRTAGARAGASGSGGTHRPQGALARPEGPSFGDGLGCGGRHGAGPCGAAGPADGLRRGRLSQPGALPSGREGDLPDPGPGLHAGLHLLPRARGRAPAPPDPDEPRRVAEAAARSGVPPSASGRVAVRHVVVTSVTRDDLPDGGAAQFAATVHALRRELPGALVEVLVPDFRGRTGAMETVLRARPDVVGHNLESVPGLYPRVRPGAEYAEALALIARASASGVPTRSGLLLGLGEDGAEVLGVMRDLARAGCRRLWLGQYLRPTPARRPVARYVSLAEFERLAAHARRLGFEEVAAGPLVRSSCSGGPSVPQ
ncbi:MAG TPA: hypothetical protein DGR79_02215 [Clostridiales bacterium]|nr:hypothetical protein [Clostridiales bacterium]